MTTQPHETVRLRDVALHAGVSPATVSRTLNGDPRVAAYLAQKVNASVKELGYRRNQLARNLRRQRVDAIGIVVSDLDNPHFSEMVGVAEEEGFRLGLRVLVCGTNESAEKQATYLQMMGDDRVAGVILSPSNPAGAEIGQLLDQGIPVVAFDREVDDPRADVVIADNVGGVATATKLMIDNGHQAIAFVGGRRGVETAEERLAGYKQAMRAARLKTNVAAADFRIEGGRTAVERLLAAGVPPTALVVANNLMTLGALKAARDAGRRIPDDLALIGVDDPYWAEFVNPSITSLAQPVRAMAHEALSMLRDRLAGRVDTPRRSVHPLELRIRSSSGRSVPGSAAR